MAEKPLVWLGTTLADLRAFPPTARREAGYQLRRVQNGSMPIDWKSVPDIGTGVIEIRIHSGVEHRVFYIAKFSEGIYVLHAFEKRTRRTPQTDMQVARRRLQGLVRKQRKE